MICLKVGINSSERKNRENGKEVIASIINYLEKNELENIALIKTEFRGYVGENPSLEVIIPGKGQVVFGNVGREEVLDILERYLIKNDEILKFLIKNR